MFENGGFIIIINEKHINKIVQFMLFGEHRTFINKNMTSDVRRCT